MFNTLERSLLIVVICALVLPACGPVSTPLPTPSELDLQAEEQAVLAAAFAGLYGEPRMYVLRDQTSPGMEGVEGLDSTVTTYLSQLTGLQQSTSDSFRLRNEEVVALRPDMDLGLPYVLLAQGDYDEIFAINTSSWDVFYTRYPNSPGLTTVSVAGFNEDLTQAVIYVGTISHWLAGAGYYLLLEKTSGAWQVVQQVMAWIS